MIDTQEVFKPINGYEGIYKISSAGTVLSMKSFYNPNPIGYVDSVGYLSCTLRKEGKKKDRRIHVLVAEHFLEKPSDPNCIFVNHKDGDKTNPDVSNLEWVTPGQNSRHAIDTGLTKNKGQDSSNAKLTDELVLEIRQLYHTCSQGELADRFNMSRRHIGDIINGVNWKHLPLQDYSGRKVVSRPSLTPRKKGYKRKVRDGIDLQEFIYQDAKKGEIFKEIPNYEGLYFVSNFGRIKGAYIKTAIMPIKISLVRMGVRGNRGYPIVRLIKNGTTTGYYVHELVANAFCKKDDSAMNLIVHIDGNRLNSVAENLIWCL